MSDDLFNIQEWVDDESAVENFVQSFLVRFGNENENRDMIVDSVLYILLEGSEKSKQLVSGYVPRVIKYDDNNYQKLVKLFNREEYDTSVHLAYDLVNRDAGIHPDGSIPWEKEKIDKPVINKQIFYDSRHDFYYFIDENGDEVECDNAGNKLND